MNKVVFIPFIAVPHRAPFRYDKKWWKRMEGTENFAICLSKKKANQVIEENEIVAITKKRLPKRMWHEIVAEI